MKRKNRSDNRAVVEAPCAPDMNVGMAINACKEEPRRPSKVERRAKLIAAHVALDAVRHDLHDYSDYESIGKTQASIAAAIGRLELHD